ncbi:MAG: calcium/sodium antiporter [Prevotella sp.]|nr:calcium/sodium antiporter [Prevotella sp.]
MLLQFLLIVVGVALVLWGADRMTEGAASLARRLSVPEIVIGLTIVAAGTSAPELFVSVVSALNGTPDLAVGNVVGSNTMNAMLIVGVSAMVAPMVISRSTVRRDIPFAVVASVLLLVLCLDGMDRWSVSGNSISRMDGIILLIGFAVFMTFALLQARKGQSTGQPEAADGRQMPVWRGLAYVALGLLCLVIGSNLFVDAATKVAQQLGVSEGVIGLTIVAGGTSLPELATSVVAARKGQSAIAIGNVIGSNVFNILMILGLTAVISPMQIEGITLVDLAVMLVSVALVWLFSATKLTVARWEGAVLTIGYIVYLAWLISQL